MGAQPTLSPAETLSQTPLTGDRPPTQNRRFRSLQSRTRDLAVPAGRSAPVPRLREPCAPAVPRTVPLGPVPPSRSSSIAVARTTLPSARTTTWPATVVGLTTLSTTSSSTVVSVATTTTHTLPVPQRGRAPVTHRALALVPSTIAVPLKRTPNLISRPPLLNRVSSVLPSR